jgi:SAM-dependent methyltransferase
VSDADLPTRETLAFLERVLPPSPARLLEVGAGDGAVSVALAARGYDVTALDEALDRPEGAAADRVRWIERDFLHYDGGSVFDVVLFTRSLHHLAPIEDALARAIGALAPGGRVVAEEFAYDRVNLPTARWFYDLQAVLEAAGIVAAAGDAGDEGNPLGRWRREHAGEPPLPTGHAILAAARERLDLTLVEEAPYLYRYVWERLQDGEAASRTAEMVLRIERRLVRERDIAAAGLRFVGLPL